MGLEMARMDWLGRNILKLVGIGENRLIFINTALNGAKSAVSDHRAKIAPNDSGTPPYPQLSVAWRLLIEWD